MIQLFYFIYSIAFIVTNIYFLLCIIDHKKETASLIYLSECLTYLANQLPALDACRSSSVQEEHGTNVYHLKPVPI